MQRWLHGGGNWGNGYYAPTHRTTMPDCAVCLATVKNKLHGPASSFAAGPGDDNCTMLFRANATYEYDGFVIDWAKPFPPIAERGPIVEWVESWIDRIQFIETTGWAPWDTDVPPTPTVSEPPEVLTDLDDYATNGMGSIALDLIADRLFEKVAPLLVGKTNTPTKATPVQTQVVLWEGAEHNVRNVRLARTRTAYLEAHGNVPAALKALNEDGIKMSRSTFYNHLEALDEAIPRWRATVQLSNSTGNLEGMRSVGTRRKSRD